MLQQILKDMYIDPELLAELPEDQKQYLFDKMREEQVRRWFVREKEQKEKEKNSEERQPRKNDKKVDFLSGTDGNEWVWVMGEHSDDKSIEQILEEEAERKAIEQAEREIRKEMEEARRERERPKIVGEAGDLQEKEEKEEKIEDTGGEEKKIKEKEAIEEVKDTGAEEGKEQGEEMIEAKEDEEAMEKEKEKIETKEEEEAKKPEDEEVKEEKTAEKFEEVKEEGTNEEKKIKEEEEENRRKKREEEKERRKKKEAEEKENKRKKEEEEKELRRKEKEERRKESEEKRKAKEEEKENKRKEKEEEKENKRKKKEEEKAAKKDNAENGKIAAPADKEQKEGVEGVKLRKRGPVSEEEQLRKLIMRRSREILFDFKSVRSRFEQLARTDAKEVKRHWKKQEEKARAVEAEIRQERQRVRAEQAQKPEPEALFNLQLMEAEPAGAPMDESPAKPAKPPRPSHRGPAPSPPPVPPRPRVTRRPANSQAALLWFHRQQKPRGAAIDPSSRVPFSWFHGLISRSEAEARLEEEAEGGYLIRISERLFGYAVSVRDRFRCKHFLVEALESGYRLFGLGEHRVHATLGDFVDYHARHPLTALGQEKLLSPVAPTFDSPTDQDAFYVEFFPERPNQDVTSNL